MDFMYWVVSGQEQVKCLYLHSKWYCWFIWLFPLFDTQLFVVLLLLTDIFFMVKVSGGESNYYFISKSNNAFIIYLSYFINPSCTLWEI